MPNKGGITKDPHYNRDYQRRARASLGCKEPSCERYKANSPRCCSIQCLREYIRNNPQPVTALRKKPLKVKQQHDIFDVAARLFKALNEFVEHQRYPAPLVGRVNVSNAIAALTTYQEFWNQ